MATRSGTQTTTARGRPMSRAFITTTDVTPGYTWTAWLGYEAQGGDKALETAETIIGGWAPTEAKAREQAKDVRDRRFNE